MTVRPDGRPASTRTVTRRRLAAAVLMATALVLWAAGWLVPPLAGWATGTRVFEFWLEATLATPTFSVAGGLVVRRRPAHPIGWLILVIGVMAGLQLALGVVATGGPVGSTAVRMAGLASLGAQWTLTGLLAVLVVLFPTGRPPTRRLWAVVASITAGATLAVVTRLLTPGPQESFPRLQNPAPVEAPAAVAPLGVASALLLLVGLAGVLAATITRLRRSAGVERQQVKLFLYVAALAVLVLPIGGVVPQASAWDQVGHVLWALFPVSLVVAMVFAVLRHGLYEIDRIVSRTVTYAVVTAVLAGVYAVVAVVPAAVFGLESDLMVAVATLAIAAAFGPVRRRVQGWVDRRFDRARYDAAQEIAGFGGRLRDELDLADLRADLVTVVGRTVQPVTVSVWTPEPPN